MASPTTQVPFQHPRTSNMLMDNQNYVDDGVIVGGPDSQQQ